MGDVERTAGESARQSEGSMSRTKGAKDLKPRRRAGQPVNEFMPTTGTLDERVDRLLMVPERQDEPEAETVEVFAASVLNDPAYRQSVRERAKSGRLMPVEARMLVEWGKMAPDKLKPRPDLARAVACMTEEELQIFAQAARITLRALARADGYQEPGDDVRRLVTTNLNGDEIVTWR